MIVYHGGKKREARHVEDHEEEKAGPGTTRENNTKKGKKEPQLSVSSLRGPDVDDSDSTRPHGQHSMKEPCHKKSAGTVEPAVVEETQEAIEAVSPSDKVISIDEDTSSTAEREDVNQPVIPDEIPGAFRAGGGGGSEDNETLARADVERPVDNESRSTMQLVTARLVPQDKWCANRKALLLFIGLFVIIIILVVVVAVVSSSNGNKNANTATSHGQDNATLIPTDPTSMTPTGPPSGLPTDSSSAVPSTNDPTNPITASPTIVVQDERSDFSCENAMQLKVDGTKVVGSLGNALEPTEDITSCSSYSGGYPGVWFTFVGTGSHIAVSTCTKETNFDTAIAVYNSSNDTCDSLGCIGGDDDSYCNHESLASTYILESVADEVYYAAVQHLSGSTGSSYDFGLFMEELSLYYCEEATGPLPLNGSITVGTTVEARHLKVDCLGELFSSQGLWFSLVGTGKPVAVSTCTEETNFDTLLLVYSSSDGSCDTLSCIGYDRHDGSSCLAAESSSSHLFDTDADEIYYILVMGENGETGSFGLFLGEVTHKGCEDAIGPLPLDGSVTLGSTADAPETIANVSTSLYRSPGLWYTMVGTGRFVLVSTCTNATDFDTVVFVYHSSNGSCDTLTYIILGSDDSSCLANTEASSYAFKASADEVYYVLVMGYGGSVGSFGLTLSDDFRRCEDATGPLQLEGTVDVGPIANATRMALTCVSIDWFYTGFGAWYTFVGTGREILFYVTCADESVSNSATLAVYYSTDDTCDFSGCEVGRGLLSCGVKTVIYASNNTVYYLALMTSSADETGNYGLTLSDDFYKCDTSTGPLPADGSITVGSNEDASSVVAKCWGFPWENVFVGSGVWYTFIGTGGTITASTCANETDFSTDLFVYWSSDGTCDALSSCIGRSTDENGCEATSYASSISFDSDADEVYFLLVMWSGNQSGNFGISLSELSIGCENADGPLPVDGSITAGSTEGAAQILVTCANDDFIGPGLWFTFVGNGGEITVSTCTHETNFDTIIAVYSSTGAGTCDAISTCIGSANSDDNDSACSVSSGTSLVFQSILNVVYYVAILGVDGHTGDFGLQLLSG